MSDNSSEPASESRSVAIARSKSALRCSRWLFGAIVIVGSLQVGIDWGVEGPKAGFFPFYIGVMIVGGERVQPGPRVLIDSDRDKCSRLGPACARCCRWSSRPRIYVVAGADHRDLRLVACC